MLHLLLEKLQKNPKKKIRYKKRGESPFSILFFRKLQVELIFLPIQVFRSERQIARNYSSSFLRRHAMDGKVIMANISNGYIALESTTGITVIEMLGDDLVQVGDMYTGNFDKIGNKTIRNKSQSKLTDVCIKGINCTLEQAEKLMK